MLVHRRHASLFLIAALACSLAACARERSQPVARGADGRVVETYDSTFVAEVVRPERPTVVYYHALGCMPCALLAPHLGPVAKRFEGRVTFWSLDWGWSAARYERYQVQAVPTLVFYVGEREVDRRVGVSRGSIEDTLAAWVERSLVRAQAMRDSALLARP